MKSTRPLSVASAVVAAIFVIMAGTSLSGATGGTTLSPVYDGPVLLSDLRQLLPDNTQFQVYEFDAEVDFCLYFDYAYQVSGTVMERNDWPSGFCNRAGPNRVVAAMSRLREDDGRIESKIKLSFSVYNLRTGSGGSFGYHVSTAQLEGPSFLGMELKSNALTDNASVDLLIWRLNERHRRATQEQSDRHEIVVSARLAANHGSVIGTAR